jgi:hypothetical protein
MTGLTLIFGIKRGGKKDECSLDEQHFPGNIDDQSWTLTPEVLYTGITNWELRLRTGIIVGVRNSDFGEKQNDYRIELRAGYYF